MGWNGAQSYGVRVESSRLADYAATAGSANSATTAGTANNLIGKPTLHGTTYIGRTLADASNATTPTYSFKNDPDTGMYSDGYGNLNFSTNGMYRGRFDGGGNLGITSAFYGGGGGGLTGFAGSLTAANTDSISGSVHRGYVWTGIQQFKIAKGNGAYGGNVADLHQFFSDDLGCSGFSWHRGDGYVTNMTLDPDNCVRMGGWSAPSSRFTFEMGPGNFYAAGNISAFSDARRKKNWVDAPADFVERWATVTAGTYDRTDQELTQVGMVAQDVQAILPHAVSEDAEGMLSLNYGGAAAVATVELAKELVKLRKRFDQQAVVLAKLMEKFK